MSLRSYLGRHQTKPVDPEAEQARRTGASTASWSWPSRILVSPGPSASWSGSSGAKLYGRRPEAGR